MTPENKRRVVVTGMGTINSLADSVEATWLKLLAGESGIGPITLFDTARYGIKVNIAGEVKDFNPLAWGITKKECLRFDRVTQFAVAATVQALQQANLAEFYEEEQERIGVIIGTGVGGLGTTLREQDRMNTLGTRLVSAFTVPGLMPNAPSNVVSIRYGYTGPSFPITTACAAGADAIGYGYKAILHDEADIMIVGGAEAPILPLTMAAFGNMQALSTRAVSDPSEASCPFDVARDGFVIAEGATILVLEEEMDARTRGATILGRIVGYGQTTDAYDLTKPGPDGSEAARSMFQALYEAKSSLNNIALIHAHGTSTPLNDKTETMAIKRVLGGTTPTSIPVTASKSMTGHSLGASGAFGALVCLLALQTGIAPQTLNLKNQDPECDLNHIHDCPRALDLSSERACALSNAFAFGGSNAALVFGRADS